MPTITQFLNQAAHANVLYLEKYNKKQLNEMLGYIGKAKDLVVARLAGNDLTTLGKARQKDLLTQLDAELQVIYGAMSSRVSSSLEVLTQYEVELAAKLLNVASTVKMDVASLGLLEAAVMARKLEFTGQAITIAESLAKFSTAKREQIFKRITAGVISGETTQDISRAIELLAGGLHKAQANALSTTLISHISNASREELVSSNPDIIDGVEWVSVIDGTTDDECIALDGKIFAVGEGPRPPIHYNCRCTTIPNVRAEYSVKGQVTGVRPVVTAKGVEFVSGDTQYSQVSERL